MTNYSNKPKRIVTQEGNDGVLSIKGKGNKVKLKAISGYTKSNEVMAVVKDTGDNLEFTFKSWFPDRYPEHNVTLDYSQAYDMYLLLRYLVDFSNLCGKDTFDDVERKDKTT